jgi:putative transposase
MIAVEKPNFPIARMCRWAEVSESGFHAWARRTPSLNARRRVFLAGEIKRVFDESNGIFGYRKVHVRLAEEGIDVCDRVVRELMAELGLVSCHPKKWRHLTQPDGTPPAPDLVRREFTASRPGVRLVGDITQVDTWEGPVFLATVINLFNREVVGWAMAEHHRASLVCDAIVMARQNRRVRRRAVFHSDRGAEYTSTELRRCRCELHRGVLQPPQAPPEPQLPNTRRLPGRLHHQQSRSLNTATISTHSKDRQARAGRLRGRSTCVRTASGRQGTGAQRGGAACSVARDDYPIATTWRSRLCTVTTSPTSAQIAKASAVNTWS